MKRFDRIVEITKKAVSLLVVFACLGMVMSSVKDAFSSKKNESNRVGANASVDYSTLTMNCLGDSVTAGGTSYPSYTTYVKTQLGLKQVRNYGVGGTTIATSKSNSFIDRYSSMDTNAQIVSVFGGLNDYDYTSIGDPDDTDTATLYGAFNTLIPALIEMYPNAYIFIIAPYAHWSNSKGQIVDETCVYPTGHTPVDINQAILNVGELHDIDVLDLWSILDTEESSFYDGVHPNEEFVETVLAPVIVEFIKANYI